MPFDKGYRSLFTGVRGRGFLRTSPFGDSAKFACKVFSEAVAPVSQLCYLVCKRSGGERVGGEGEENACDESRLYWPRWL